jgi:hypothetical protein
MRLPASFVIRGTLVGILNARQAGWMAVVTEMKGIEENVETAYEDVSTTATTPRRITKRTGEEKKRLRTGECS